MSNTSNDVKQRWNNANYTQVKVAINPSVAAEFKAACAAADVSMAGTLCKFMADYCSTPLSTGASAGSAAAQNPFATRKKRREALKHMITQLELLLLAEETYRDNIPENLQRSKWYDMAEDSIAKLQEALDIFSDVY